MSYTADQIARIEIDVEAGLRVVNNCRLLTASGRQLARIEADYAQPYSFASNHPDIALALVAYFRETNRAQVEFNTTTGFFRETAAEYDALVAAEPETIWRSPPQWLTELSFFWQERQSRIPDPPSGSVPDPEPGLVGFIQLSIKGNFADLADAEANVPASGISHSGTSYSASIAPWVPVGDANPAEEAGKSLFVATATGRASADGTRFDIGAWFVSPFGVDQDIQYTTSATRPTDATTWVSAAVADFPDDWTYYRQRINGGAWGPARPRNPGASLDWVEQANIATTFTNARLNWDFAPIDLDVFNDLLIRYQWRNAGGDITGEVQRIVSRHLFHPVVGAGNADTFRAGMTQRWALNDDSFFYISLPQSTISAGASAGEQRAYVQPYNNQADVDAGRNVMRGLRFQSGLARTGENVVMRIHAR